MPGSLSWAASTATDPEPAPTSQTTPPGGDGELRQGDGPDLGLGDETALGRLWAKASSGLPKRRGRAARRVDPAGPACD